MELASRRDVELCMRTAWLAIVCAACGGEPIRTAAPTTPRAAPAAVLAPPSSAAAMASANAPPEGPSVAELLASRAPMWWLVRDRGGAPRCAAFKAEPWTTPGTGKLTPVEPQTRLQATVTLLSPEGPKTIAPVPVDPYRTIELQYELSEEALTLHTPRGLLSRQSAELSSCRVRHPQAALPWFAAEQDCLAARGHTEPMRFGACADVIPAFPFDDQGPNWLGPRIAAGGEAYELEVTDQVRRCTAWRFTPDGGPREGRMQSQHTEGIRTTVTSYGYEYWDARITLLGPSYQTFEHGREVSNLGYGCGETRYVRHLAEGHSTIAGRHWYATKLACEKALPAAVVKGKQGC